MPRGNRCRTMDLLDWLNQMAVNVFCFSFRIFDSCVRSVAFKFFDFWTTKRRNIVNGQMPGLKNPWKVTQKRRRKNGSEDGILIRISVWVIFFPHSPHSLTENRPNEFRKINLATMQNSLWTRRSVLFGENHIHWYKSVIVHASENDSCRNSMTRKETTTPSPSISLTNVTRRTARFEGR